MEKWKAKRDFAAADELFQSKKYNDALEILNRLNREFPNNRRVMMPRALCLAEIGRYHEAATLCEQILSEQDYPRARRLLKKLQPYIKGAHAPAYEPPGAFDYLEAQEPTEPKDSAFGDERPLYLQDVDRGGGWGKPLLISFVVILLAAAIGGGVFYAVVHQKLGRPEVAQREPAAPVPAPVTPAPVEEEPYVPDFGQYNKYADPQAVAQVQQQLQTQQPLPPAPFPGERQVQQAAEEPSGPATAGSKADTEGADISDEGLLGLGVGLLVILFVVASVLEFVVLFCTLMLLNKMPRPTLGENVLLIAGVAVVSVLVSRIPYIGWFASLFMIITVFQLTLVDCLVMILVNAVVMIAAALVFVGLVGASLWALL